MKWLIGLMFICVSTGYPKKGGKAFSLFSVVHFKNEECTTTMSPTMNGLCVSSSDCTETGGTKSGNCASGFGVCCFYSVETCDGANTITNNVTYLQNEGYPTAITTAETCTYNIQGRTDICQIRLDFDNFVVSQPAVAGAVVGQCADTADRITIGIPNGANTNNICGTLTGQHMYFDTNRAAGTAAVVTITTVGTAVSRTWKVKVRTLECSSTSLANAGCLQWFTGLSGRIQSFNNAAMAPIIQQGLNYNICIRDEKNSCGMFVRESNPGGLPTSFLINDPAAGGTVPTAAVNTKEVTDAGAAGDTTLCSLAGVIINGDGYCGGTLSTIAASTIATPVNGGAAPYQIGVVTTVADLQAGHLGSRFDLTYSLTPCG